MVSAKLFNYKKDIKVKKNLMLGFKAIAAVLTVVGVSTVGLNVSESRAALTGPSGKCALTLSRNFSGMNERVKNWDSVTVMSIGVIDFDAKTYSTIDTEVKGYGTLSAATNKSTESGTISVVAGSFGGLYQMTVNGTGKVNVISTNSGNTLFISTEAGSDNGPQMTGVCQAL